MNLNPRTRWLVFLSLMAALVILLGMPSSPVGFVKLGVINATTVHIPVIIGAMILGPWGGAILGAIFGILSLINAVVNPSLFSPAFLNPLISILPRVLFGLIAGFMYRGWEKLSKGKVWSVPVSAVLSTACHTCMVMGGIWLLGNWFPGMSEVSVQVPALLGGILLVNTIPEMVLAGVVCTAVMAALRPIIRRNPIRFESKSRKEDKA